MAKVDILILGGGIAGLYIGKKLSALGLSVMLVEKSPTLADGPTTRNGSLLHAGGFHSAVIENEIQALNNGADCRDGSRQISAYCPEALRRTVPIYLAFRDSSLADRATYRWNSLELPHTYISSSTDGARRKTGCDLPMGTQLFSAKDSGIDFRILCLKLAQDIKYHRGIILVSATTVREDVDRFHITVGSKTQTVYAEKVIHANGYRIQQGVSNNAYFFSSTPRFVLWKSHSLAIAANWPAGFLYVDASYPSIVPTSNGSIVNISQRDIPVPSPNFDVVSDEADALWASLLKININANSLKSIAQVTACLKPSIIRADGKRTVDIVVHHASPHDIIALPGKATTAPLLADRIVQSVFGKYVPEITAPLLFPISKENVIEEYHPQNPLRSEGENNAS